jgi:hypothetical protein
MKRRWKVYFVVFTVLTVIGWVGMATHPAQQDPLTLLRVIPEAILPVGLFGYAFGVRIGTPLIWRVVAALSALGMVVLVGQLIYAGLNPVGNVTLASMVLAMGIVAVLVLPAVVAMIGYANWLTEAKPPADAPEQAYEPQPVYAPRAVAPGSGFGRRGVARS